jgi:hypothetical protein
MTEERQREQWLQDVRDRQKNVVFPQTLANEARLWRNIGTRTPTLMTWVGLTILAIFVLGFMAFFFIVSAQAGLAWVVVLATLLVFGPIFGAILWATRRNLRNLENSHRSSNARR